MGRYRNMLVVALTVGMLALAGSAVADCGAEHAKNDQSRADRMVSLQGCLSQNMDGSFRLIERESGESVELEAAQDLRIDDHVGQTVKVTGHWVDESGSYGDDSSSEYGTGDHGNVKPGKTFKVSKIETVSETCES